MKQHSKLPFFNRNGQHVINIKPLTVQAWRTLPFINLVIELTPSQHFKQRKALVMACTDITEDEFETFSVPDFNVLSDDIQSFILCRSDRLKGETLEVKDWHFELYFPYETAFKEIIKHIKFKAPLVAASAQLAELDNDIERENYMFSAVCGIDSADLELMTTNDYLTLKPRVGDFFTQSGDYFLPMMLTPL